LIQQSTDFARHTIGTAQPLVGEILSASERVSASDVRTVAPESSPVIEVTPADTSEPSPTAWDWTAGPAPINLAPADAPEGNTPASVTIEGWQVQHYGPAWPSHLPVSVLLSMASTIAGGIWAIASDTHTHPAASGAVITIALGLLATITTTMAAVSRDGR
jgi:hypothetical protein